MTLTSKLLLACLLALLPSCMNVCDTRGSEGNIFVAPPRGSKVIRATWNEDLLWYFYRPFRCGEVPETVVFKRYTPAGEVEEVSFIEQ